MNSADQKQVLIIAGPNGAGKTTFARTFLAPLKDRVRFINADYIAAGLSPFDPELVAVRAGKIMLEEVESCFQRGESFAIETTLSGRGYLKHIKRWREAGYKVRLMFLSLDDVGIAIQRVARRVAHGGHNIPVPVIQRRFKAGLTLLHSDYRHAVDEWLLYDNSGEKPTLLRQGVNK
ncbi:zeta toxin family protein [Halopseudomonas xiamenensis]|uniref:zeta toxin family protein n=1 Tax=Halopseudomonas xiamenensis TaxID=157792 RepID=UPI0016295379|nr:zeta toxin family protein [Halopseudomonas xiamenensis]